MIGYIISLNLLINQGNYLPDLWTDDSIEVYAGPDHALNDPFYEPPLLVTIPTTQTLQPMKEMQLRIDALLSLTRLSRDIYDEIGLPLVIVSAYRDHNYQQYLINTFGDGNLRAKPGHSEHQLGLAVDIMGLSNAHMEGDTNASLVYQWLVKYGHEYGRHQSYQYGLQTDGYYPEKWHRRYVGPTLATVLKNTNQTLTQYFYEMIRPIDPSTGAKKAVTPHVFSSRISRSPHRPPPPQSTNHAPIPDINDAPTQTQTTTPSELFNHPL